MTTPAERTRAVLYTKSFLEDLMNPRETPRVPKTIREQARRLLRHYPNSFDMEMAAESLTPTGWKTFGGQNDPI